MDKAGVIHAYDGTIRSHKKEGNPAIMTWMDHEGIILSEISQRETNTV